MKEIWKPLNIEYQNCIANDAGSDKVYLIMPNKYEVSNTGKIRNAKAGWEISQHNGYTKVTLDTMHKVNYSIDHDHWVPQRLQFSIARLVYGTFVRPLKANERVYKYKPGACSVDNLYVQMTKVG